jgi:hypothetical protein
MEQNHTTSVARRAQHQQRRDIVALEEIIQRDLLAARVAHANLDLEVCCRTGTKHHLRVTAIHDGLLVGTVLRGFRDDVPRKVGGETAIRIASIAMIERIAGCVGHP